jgi:hypothetical protein
MPVLPDQPAPPDPGIDEQEIEASLAELFLDATLAAGENRAALTATGRPGGRLAAVHRGS